MLSALDTRCYKIISIILLLLVAPASFAQQQQQPQYKEKPNSSILDDVVKQTEYERSKGEVSRSASKGGASAIARKAASVGRASAQMAKRYGKGGLQGIVGSYLLDRVLEATDYVLDEKNNTIRKKVDQDDCKDDGSGCPNAEFLYSTNSVVYDWKNGVKQHVLGKSASPVEACQQYASFMKEFAELDYQYKSASDNTCYVTYLDQTRQASIGKEVNKNYELKEEPKATESEIDGLFQKYLASHQDYNANEIIKNAYSNNPNGSELSDEMDREIDKGIREAKKNPEKPYSTKTDDGTSVNVFFGDSKPSPETSTDSQNKPDPESGTNVFTGDSPSPNNETGTNPNPNNETQQIPKEEKWPEYCSWADVHCQWMKWTQEDDVDIKDENIDVDDQEDDVTGKMQSVSIGNGAYCPAPMQIPINLPFVKTTLEMKYEPMCSACSQIRPVIIMLGWIIGAYIIAGKGWGAE